MSPLSPPRFPACQCSQPAERFGGQLLVRATVPLLICGLQAKLKVDPVACPIAPSSRPQPLFPAWDRLTHALPLGCTCRTGYHPERSERRRQRP